MNDFNFRRQLFQNTRVLHDKAETMPVINQILEQKISLEDYIFFLETMWSFHKEIERNFLLYANQFLEYGLDVQDYFRSGHVEKDLRTLGFKNTNNIKSLTKIPIDCFEEAIGFMYVLTGSTMGGAILKEKIRLTFRGSSGESAINYFNGFGEKNEFFWQKFLNFMELITSNSTETVKENIGSGAILAFEQFIKYLSGITINQNKDKKLNYGTTSTS